MTSKLIEGTRQEKLHSAYRSEVAAIERRYKNVQKLIWFDKPLAKRIAKAAKQADTDAAKWIRQACREKLQREKEMEK